MIKKRILIITLLVLILSLGLVGCGPAKTIEQTYTEEEFMQEEFFCQDNGLLVNFQPGMIVCTGVIDEEAIIFELVPEVTNGLGYFQIIRFMVEGESMPGNMFADVNEMLAQETYTADEGYQLTSIVITDDDLTLTSNLIEEAE